MRNLPSATWRGAWHRVLRAVAVCGCTGLPSAVLAQTATPAPAPPAVRRHHGQHYHHHYRRHATAVPSPPAPEAQAPVPPAYTEAPRPSADLLPPHEYIPPSTSVVPGTLQLHYPPSGNGYVTGSSPQALDDDRTAKVPGVTLHVPLQPDPAPSLPPPEDPLH